MPELRLPLDYVPPCRVGYHADRGVVQRGFWLDDRPIVFRFEQEPDDGPITARAFCNGPVDDVEDRLREAARHAISADDDVAAFHAAVAGDPPMAELAGRFPGLKPLRVPDLWTALFWGLIDQQLSNAAGRAIRARIAESFGPAIDVDGSSVSILPGPATVLAVSHRELCGTGLSERKAAYAKEIAEAVVAGEVELERTSRLPDTEALQALVDVRGVGLWTAECAAIFGLGEPDILPADDLGIRKAVGRLYHLPQVPEAAEVRRIGEQWAGWRSYAAVYLWHSRAAAGR